LIWIDIAILIHHYLVLLLLCVWALEAICKSLAGNKYYYSCDSDFCEMVFYLLLLIPDEVKI
jgi:hypothetical protein